MFAASLSGHCDVVNKLIEAGASVNVTNKDCLGSVLN